MFGNHIIKTVSEIKRQYGKALVLVSGCFDVWHVGHLHLIEFAREKGGVVIGINSDRAIKELKGDTRPINKESDRLIFASFMPVSQVFVIDDTTITKTILQIKPDIWIKGSDWSLETMNQDEVSAARQVGTAILFAPHLEGYSSTNIIERMKQ